jgi:hypothetical protein
MSAVARGPPTAKPGCPEPYRELINRHLTRIYYLTPAYLKLFKDHKAYSSLTTIIARVRARAFLEGFNVSSNSTGNKNVSGA